MATDTDTTNSDRRTDRAKRHDEVLAVIDATLTLAAEWGYTGET